MTRSCWHDWRLGLGVLLTLLALGVFVPQASAGCSYPTVVVSSRAGTSHQSVDGLSPSPLPYSLPQLPHPCSGPDCSSAPQAPQAPPATTIAPIEEWACLALISAGADYRGTTHQFEDGPDTPIFRTFQVYHPPR